MIRHIGSFIVLCTGSFVTLAAAGTLAAADDKPEKVKIEDITLAIPADWKQEEPANKLRKAQFKVGPAKGDTEPAEMVVSTFGGGGGGVDANLQRWIKQFAKDGLKAKVTEGSCPQGTYYLSDLTGTYNKPIGPPIQGKSEPVKGYRSIGVILQVPDQGVYFLKLTGPEKTVTANLDAMRSTFGGNAEKEEAYEVK